MNFREKLSTGRILAGTFVKTSSADIIEILALSGLDFICLDAEHSAFSRRELDWSLALARALGLSAFVRLSHGSADTILQALDGGAAGIVVPHVDSLATARQVARRSRFGPGGRGYSGTTRYGGFSTRGMAEILREEEKNIFVIAQIEDPSALDNIEEIAATPGIDALFYGAADMAVGLGLDIAGTPEVEAAFSRVAAAAHAAGKPLAAHCGAPVGLAGLKEKGVSLAFVGSDQGLVLTGARAIAAAASD
ncbi:2-keto-3-deoxy-L-rhamnonate aldolase [Ensifer psoraleae]|uniref:HpcH/HpaI aldolase family protein n=1 Tax=Sinorhizobium psoraleae TaxID=520838 RepID=UPI0015697D61|nr:aldolase/citrate lyase family protein [Sinorhizobium psoraleae]NRP72145.1 2-keto-3-deoxy-L-rhamnonate aldolase [Sinorhizobium psoraleae]